jgi:16S rRNA (uracil1498-N3)-methyltransferase
MHRCYVNPANWNESDLFLSAEEEHHLLHVLRAKAGDTVAVFDGRGSEATAEIRMDGAPGKTHRVVLRILGVGKSRHPGLSLTLIQALPKGKRMDLIVEKAVELGVTDIIPVITERTIVRLDADARKERGERWQRLALSASRQCGTSWVPDVRSVCDYSEAMRNCREFDLLLVGSLGDDARPLHDVLNEARRKTKAALIIGPEGDLTSAEIKEAMDAGAVPVSFGQLVLRVETAALYGLSVLNYELGEK